MNIYKTIRGKKKKPVEEDDSEEVAVLIKDADTGGEGLWYVAKSCSKASKQLGGLSVSDVAIGLKYLIRQKQLEKEENLIPNVDLSHKLADRDVVQSLHLIHYLRLISATYGKDLDMLLQRSKIFTKNDILLYVPKSDNHRPAHYLALDHVSKAVILGIRGTASFSDALTDITSNTVDFVDGYAHEGMVLAANWFFDHVTPEIQKALATHSDYALRIVGHSLGAGTAALLTIRYMTDAHDPSVVCKQVFPDTDVRCVCFAPPACIDPQNAPEYEDFILSIILGDDIVPRFQCFAAECVRIELMEYPWGREFKDDIKNTALVRYTSSGMTTIDRKLKISAAASRSKRLVTDRLLSRQTEEEILRRSLVPRQKSSAQLVLPPPPGGEESTVTPTAPTAATATHPAPRPAEGEEKKKKGRTVGGTFKSMMRPLTPRRRTSEEAENPDSTATCGHPAAAGGGNTEEEEDVIREEFKKLNPPGRILHIREGPTAGHFSLVQCANSYFETISLSDSMLSDHTMGQYARALEYIMQDIGINGEF